MEIYLEITWNVILDPSKPENNFPFNENDFPLCFTSPSERLFLVLCVERRLFSSRLAPTHHVTYNVYREREHNRVVLLGADGVQGLQVCRSQEFSVSRQHGCIFCQKFLKSPKIENMFNRPPTPFKQLLEKEKSFSSTREAFLSLLSRDLKCSWPIN